MLRTRRARRRALAASLGVIVIGALVATVLVLTRDEKQKIRYEAATPGESVIESSLRPPPVPRDLAPSTTTTSTRPVPTTTTTPLTPGLWVSPAGNDKNDGSQQAPFRTLKQAISKLKAGDTLYIGDGEYSEAPDADTQYHLKNLNGSPDKWTVITAAPGARPRLVGGEWTTFKIEKSSYVEVRGIETVGTADADKKPTTGIEIRESHHIRVIDNYVRNGGGGGVGANQSNHIDIIGNYISGMAKWNPYQTSGIGTFEMKNIGGAPADHGYSIRIIGNVVFGTENIATPRAIGGGNEITDGNCIIIDSSDPNVYKGVAYIANNVCSNNGGRGIHVFQAGNVVAVNNTLFHNTQTASLRETGGELSAVGAANVVFRNNLVVARENRKATHVHKATGVVFENNLFADGIEADVGGDGNKVVDDTGLRDPDSGDYSLRATSPAVEAGTPTTAPSADIRGVARAGKPDIGAFEAAS